MAVPVERRGVRRVRPRPSRRGDRRLPVPARARDADRRPGLSPRSSRSSSSPTTRSHAARAGSQRSCWHPRRPPTRSPPTRCAGCWTPAPSTRTPCSGSPPRHSRARRRTASATTSSSSTTPSRAAWSTSHPPRSAVADALDPGRSDVAESLAATLGRWSSTLAPAQRDELRATIEAAVPQPWPALRRALGPLAPEPVAAAPTPVVAVPDPVDLGTPDAVAPVADLDELLVLMEETLPVRTTAVELERALDAMVRFRLDHVPTAVRQRAERATSSWSSSTRATTSDGSSVPGSATRHHRCRPVGPCTGVHRSARSCLPARRSTPSGLRATAVAHVDAGGPGARS